MTNCQRYRLLKDVQPGDLVQYWHDTDGHVVIVKQPLPPQPDGSLPTISHGSHKGLGGVGELALRLLDSGGKERAGYKFYAVRPKPLYLVDNKGIR